MAERIISETVLELEPGLVGRPLAAPWRRLSAILVDWVLLFPPVVLAGAAASFLALWLLSPPAFDAVVSLLMDTSVEDEVRHRQLAVLAPVLVEHDAPGLPSSVVVAVEAGELDRAAEILDGQSFTFSLNSAQTDKPPPPPGYVRVEMEKFIPRGIRSAALLGAAALYFTFFTSGRRRATPDKWLFGVRVQRLDGRPLTIWESFERFGGYLASAGTFGLGLLDLWRDDNRRLAHDRIAKTVVVRRIRSTPPVSSAEEASGPEAPEAG